MPRLQSRYNGNNDSSGITAQRRQRAQAGGGIPARLTANSDQSIGPVISRSLFCACPAPAPVPCVEPCKIWSSLLDPSGVITVDVANELGDWILTGPDTYIPIFADPTDPESPLRVEGWFYIYAQFTCAGCFTTSWTYTPREDPLQEWAFAFVTSTDPSSVSPAIYSAFFTNQLIGGSGTKELCWEAGQYVVLGIYSGNMVSGTATFEDVPACNEQPYPPNPLPPPPEDARMWVVGATNANPMTLYNADTSAGLTLAANPGTDLWISQLTQAGDYSWRAKVDVSGGQLFGSAFVCADLSQNSFFGGTYSSPTDVRDATDIIQDTLPSTSGFRGFIVKYDPSGFVLWTTYIATTLANNAFVQNVACDRVGNVYLSGIYNGTLTIYSTDATSSNLAYTSTPPDQYEVFVIKYNPAGILQWATRVTGVVRENLGFGPAEYKIAVDLDMNVNLCGAFEVSSVAIYNANGSLFSALGKTEAYGMYLIQWSSTGIGQWRALQEGDVGNTYLDIATDTSRNVVAVGYYRSNNLTLYNADGTAFPNTYTSSIYLSSFVLKYSQMGVAQWFAEVRSNDGNNLAYGVITDCRQNVGITGFYRYAPVIVSADLSVNLLPLPNTTFFESSYTIQFDKDGIAQWRATCRGGAGGIVGRTFGKIGTDTNDNLYVAGSYEFDPSVPHLFEMYDATDTLFTTFALDGRNNGFLVKYNELGQGVWATRQAGVGDSFAFDVTGLVLTPCDGPSPPPPPRPEPLMWVAGKSASATMSFFDPSANPDESLSNNFQDLYIGQFTQQGTFSWAAQIKVAALVAQPENNPRVCADGSGNAYFTGTFTADVNVFDSSGIPVTTLVDNSDINTALVKYDPSGGVLWALRLISPPSSNVVVEEVATDASGNVYLAGTYNGNLIIESTSGPNANLSFSGSFNNMFIIKWNSQGIYQWGTRITDVSGGSEIALRSICVDSSQNVNICGTFTAATTTIYNADTTVFSTLSRVGASSIYVVQWNSAGQGVWRALAGGNFFHAAYDITTDTSRNVIAVGAYNGPSFTVYDASNAVWLTKSSGGTQAGFVIKYTSSGFPIWFADVRGAQNITRGVVTDLSQNIDIVGTYFNSPSVFGSNGVALSPLPTPTTQGTYVAQLDASGIAIWRASSRGTINAVFGSDITTDNQQNIYLTGYYTSNTILQMYDASDTLFTTLPAATIDDGFVLQYNQNGGGVWATRQAGTGSDLGESITSFYQTP